MRSILPGAAELGFYVVEHSPDTSRIAHRFATETGQALLAASTKIDGRSRRRSFLRDHYASSVLTERDAQIRLVAHPAPGIVATMAAVYDRTPTLSPDERELLTRIVLHIETGYRARNKTKGIRAEIDERGRLIRHDGRPLSEQVVASHAQRIRFARHRRSRESPRALVLWPALAAGALTIAPRPDGSYVVLDNPPSTRALRALDANEAELLSILGRGVSSKLAAYALGVSSATISKWLASITAKVGVASRTSLLRIAALLHNDPRSELAFEKLRKAERQVLTGLERWRSNATVSRKRAHSVYTVANQVAALLRKTANPSRSSLVVRAASPAPAIDSK